MFSSALELPSSFQKFADECIDIFAVGEFSHRQPRYS